jgi:hypothetical protein
MRGRSVIVVAAVFAAIGVAIIGGWWIAANQRGDGRRPATTVTAHEATRVAARVVRELKAGRPQVPVLHCKLATPRQPYWCGSARRLTAAVVAEMLTSPSGSHRSTFCLVKSEEGDLWLIDAGVGERCLLG